MTEYIVREKQVSAVNAVLIATSKAIIDFDGMPEVVRCRDCMHNEYGICSVLSHDLEGRYDCPHMSRDWYVSPDDYCAWGKRRES